MSYTQPMTLVQEQVDQLRPSSGRLTISFAMQTHELAHTSSAYLDGIVEEVQQIKGVKVDVERLVHVVLNRSSGPGRGAPPCPRACMQRTKAARPSNALLLRMLL